MLVVPPSIVFCAVMFRQNVKQKNYEKPKTWFPFPWELLMIRPIVVKKSTIGRIAGSNARISLSKVFGK